ncbi:hypothetical protein ZWY2020_023051 [Hordeum vulgare]|nr:hypothetical protein ZWY2020_023051 [Hordeum vulgare]
MDEADFTMPFTESGWSMVVAARPDTSASMWIFLEPLTASLAFFCFTGFVVWGIEHRVNPEFRGTPSQQFGLIFYFAFSTLVFSHKEKLESNLWRTVVTIWVFVVLILTSMLTVQQLRPTVTDVKELQRRGHYIGYGEGSFIEPMLEKMSRTEKAWFGEPGACQSPLGGGGPSNLCLRSFDGLFLITGVVSSLMLLLDLAIFAYRERDQLRAAEAEAGGSSGSVSVRPAWLQHYDRRDLKSPAFKTWNDESVRNGSDSAGRTPKWDGDGGGGDASQTPTAREGEHAMGGTSPLSVCISSEMNAGSSPEGTPASKISESFEQRIEKAATSVMGRPTASELQE